MSLVVQIDGKGEEMQVFQQTTAERQTRDQRVEGEVRFCVYVEEVLSESLFVHLPRVYRVTMSGRWSGGRELLMYQSLTGSATG